ncbi:hypothetical protein [Planotetraspora mira]|uniref:Cell division protein FtsL n=1 Tax=Planotetraspora mira TaxID=58121 RepID=A0A8J3TGI2_9ACTN|nr:hypothetical protein [Planotetraspora mira]GII26725.1 hypothetical protein Pmi06nite_01670 [Planotetraspora mira]
MRTTEQDSRTAARRVPAPPRRTGRPVGGGTSAPEAPSQRRGQTEAPAPASARRGQAAAPAPAPASPRRGQATRPASAWAPDAAPVGGSTKTLTPDAPVRVAPAGAEAPEVQATSRERSARSAFRRPPRAPFVLLVVGLMCGGLVTLLLLNTVLAQDSFKLTDLRSSTDQLHEQAATLEGELRIWDQPGAIEEAAKPLGVEKDTTAPRFVKTGPSVGAADAATPREEGMVK